MGSGITSGSRAARRFILAVVFALVLVIGGAVSPARATLFVTNQDGPNLTLLDPTTGAELGSSTSPVGPPVGITVGPDHNIYVANIGNITKYNGTTGAFISNFSVGGSIEKGQGLAFGPDGNLYVANADFSNVLRYNGTTGAFINTFATTLGFPTGLTFGPNGNLFVSSLGNNVVQQFNGTTGALIGTFASIDGLWEPDGLTFGPGPAGDLYVVSDNGNEVYRFNRTTGVAMGSFLQGALPQLPRDLAFGPDGSLYVTDEEVGIMRYNGTTGAFQNVFASGGSLDLPTYLVFTPEPGSLAILMLLAPAALARRPRGDRRRFLPHHFLRQK